MVGTQSFESNEVLAKLPAHLLQYILNQDYSRYSAVDQAVWRYVMKQNIAFLPQVAHQSYLEGLEKTGISIEEIPSMYGMNRILKEIGWAAVCVDGFIPSGPFMELMAHNVLVIAQDIRQVDHIEYTPAPDIIHEAAGHAPIIANPEYAEYLRRFGEIGPKAISSKKDIELYEAVRHLSILKEAERTTEKEIKDAEALVDELQQNMGEPSEMALIRNLHWWTVEYGLIGSVEQPKIYGAGLLSSIGESKWCMRPEVKKIPYTLAAAHQSFDITKPQPQLFVTPDFAHLSFVLEAFANTMALRKGGAKGIEMLMASEQLGTVEYNTGIQISGVFTSLIKDEFQRPVYFKTTGETVLSYHEKALVGHGREYHKDGFGSPVGKLKNSNVAIEDMSPYDLQAFHINEGFVTKLEFESGLIVEGEVITGKRTLQGRIILISFKNCTVSYRDEILFHPDWGTFDMAVGKEITSVFAGPADASSFDLISHISSQHTPKFEKSEAQLQLEKLYIEVKAMRQSAQIDTVRLKAIQEILISQYPKDWLLNTEIVELLG